MSPRAACRLETLGFDPGLVFDYVAGKPDWLASGLPREGENASVLYAGEVVDHEPPACALDTPVAAVGAALEGSRYGFCLVLGPRRVVLGRVRGSTLAAAGPAATAEALMEAGPSTVRFNTPADELVQALTERKLDTAVVTAPAGCLIGVFHREDARARLTRATRQAVGYAGRRPGVVPRLGVHARVEAAGPCSALTERRRRPIGVSRRDDRRQAHRRAA